MRLRRSKDYERNSGAEKNNSIEKSKNERKPTRKIDESTFIVSRRICERVQGTERCRSE